MSDDENETHVEERDPSVTLDESASTPRIEVHANGRALVLTISEAEGLVEELQRALARTRRAHPEGCMCSACT